MENKVLVAYASIYGSTQEVADVVAATLREQGLEVDLQPMRTVRTLAEYGAVVLGAPIYLCQWLKDGQKFLEQHQSALMRLRVAIFALGPIGSDQKEWQGVRAQLDQELVKYTWLKPTAVELFGGKYNPAKLRFPDNLITSLPASPLHNFPASDMRDWTAIRAWAGSLAVQLQPA